VVADGVDPRLRGREQGGGRSTRSRGPDSRRRAGRA
jgi:hypothetical protein